jgi:hypothetical protein
VPAAAGELTVDDFRFDGPFGSQGASIEKIARSHFRVTLGHAPGHTDWCNMLGFQIVRNAKGNSLRLDVCFHGGDRYRFNHYPHSSWSYDGENWHAIGWEKSSTDSSKGDTLLFPEFTEDTVYFGHQVPFSHEDLLKMIARWQKHPHVKVHVLGESLLGRKIHRISITDPNSPHPENVRWVHYFANQHPGEHHAHWRMIGMVDWLLGDEGRDCRKRSICHFILLMSPDGPSRGWYRVNNQGVDMNRSYSVTGSDNRKQAHEAYVVQRDLEQLMASDAPVTDAWSMHTWGGIVEPILLPGPEMGTKLGPWEDFRKIISSNDTRGFVKPLKTYPKPGTSSSWNNGPHIQFGISTVLCEGAGSFTTKQENLDSGMVLMKSIAQYYRGTK